MAKFDLDDSRNDPKARGSNRLALAGVVATLALVFGGGYLQSHPWQTDRTSQQAASTTTFSYYDDLTIQGTRWKPTGAARRIPATELHAAGLSDDQRKIFTRAGGGGSNGTQVLYVELENGYYQELLPD